MSSGNCLELIKNTPRLSAADLVKWIGDNMQTERYAAQNAAIGLAIAREHIFCGDHNSFLGFAENNFGIGSSNAHRRARAGKAYIALSTIVELERDDWPRSISQADILCDLDADQIRTLWLSLKEQGELPYITAEKLKCFVAEYKTPIGVETNELPQVEHAEKHQERPLEKRPDRPLQGYGVLNIGNVESEHDGVVIWGDEEADEEAEQVVEAEYKETGSYYDKTMPPFGIDRENRLKMLAAGLKFVRLIVGDGELELHIEEWSEGGGGWQILLPSSGGVERFFERLIKQDKVCQC